MSQIGTLGKELHARHLVQVSGVTADVGAPKAPGKDLALRSIEHLHKVEAEEGGLGKKLKAGVVALLLGVTLLGAVTPAHADTLSVATPQTHGLFLANPATGPPVDVFGGPTLGGPSFSEAKVLGTQAPRSAVVDAQTKQALDAFQTRLAQILHHDASSLAQGLRPVQPGGDLDATQQKDIQRAATELLKSLPIGAFSPGVQTTLQAALGALGDHQDLSTMRLGEFGKAGGDAVSDLVKAFQKDHPAAFWSLAGVGASAAIAVGYTQGTDALGKLGIKPEVSTKIFQDVKLHLGVQAGPRFSDPRFNVGLDGQHTFDSGAVLKGGIGAQLNGKDFVSGDVHGSLSTTSGLFVDGQVKLDGSGKPFDARLSARQSFTHDVGGGGTGVLFADAKWSDGTQGTTDAASLSLGLAGTHGRWTSSVSGSYDLRSDTFSSSLSAGRTFDIQTKNDLELQIRGSVDSQGNHSVGVGATFRF